MTTFVFANNFSTTLAATASSSSSTLTLASSTGLPSLSSAEVMPLTLNDAATGQVYEIVYVTAISGATLTVTRGKEGTTAQSWAVGDYAYGAFTADSVAPVNGSPNNPFYGATPAAASNNTQFSTTAWVTSNFAKINGLINGSVGYTTSTTLTASDAHKIIFLTGTNAATFTLPSASAAPAYALPLVISNQGNGTLTIAAPSGDTLDLVTTKLESGQVCALVNDGGAAWHHLWQESVTINQFSSSFSSTDYLLLPNGFILQWVQGSLPASNATTSSVTVALKTAFPNFTLGAWAACFGSASSVHGYLVTSQAKCPDTGHITVQADTMTGNSSSPVTFNQAVPFTAYAIGR